MKLILTAEVDHLGTAGDTVEVKDGYGRNFLLPRGLAIVATKGAERQADGIRRAREIKTVRGIEHANELKTALEGLGSVDLPARTASDTGKLFGSITAADVVGAIKKAGGPNLDKRTVQLPKGHIKTLGTHPIAVRLHPDVDAAVSVNVVAEAVDAAVNWRREGHIGLHVAVAVFLANCYGSYPPSEANLPLTWAAQPRNTTRPKAQPGPTRR